MFTIRKKNTNTTKGNKKRSNKLLALASFNSLMKILVVQTKNKGSPFKTNHDLQNTMKDCYPFDLT